MNASTSVKRNFIKLRLERGGTLNKEGVAVSGGFFEVKDSGFKIGDCLPAFSLRGSLGFYKKGREQTDENFIHLPSLDDTNW